MVITVVQLVGASFLVFHVAKHSSHHGNGTSKDCVLGKVGSFPSFSNCTSLCV